MIIFSSPFITTRLTSTHFSSTRLPRVASDAPPLLLPHADPAFEFTLFSKEEDVDAKIARVVRCGGWKGDQLTKLDSVPQSDHDVISGGLIFKIFTAVSHAMGS